MLIISTGVAVCVVEILLRWSLASPNAYYELAYRFDALIYGAFLALLLSHWQQRGFPSWSQSLLKATLLIATLGICGIMFALHPVVGRDPRFSPLFLAFGLPLLSLAFAALTGLLVLRSGSNWWLSRLFRLRMLQFIGVISYTMYLVHLIAAAAIRHLFHLADPETQTFTQALLATALTIAIAQISWLCMESPLLRWKDRQFPNIPHPRPSDVPGLTAHL